MYTTIAGQAAAASRSALLAAIALALFGAGAERAHAQAVHDAARAPATDDWYLAVSGGGSFLERPKQTIANAPTPGSTLHVTNAVDDGWSAQLAAGRTLGSFRLEAEIGRTENKSKAYSATSPIQITLPQNGKNNATRYMANLYYDLPFEAFSLQPYVGAGVGAADTHLTTFAAPARAPHAPPSQILNIQSTVFAYQLTGGISRQVTRHLALTLQYRWFNAGTVDGHDSRGQRATRDIAGSNVEAGLRYRF